MNNKLIESIRERTTTYLGEKKSDTKVMTSDKDRTQIFKSEEIARAVQYVPRCKCCLIRINVPCIVNLLIWVRASFRTHFRRNHNDDMFMVLSQL